MASFSLQLDTTPPTVTLGAPGRLGTDQVRVLYGIDNDGYISLAEMDQETASVDMDGITSAQAFPSEKLIDVEIVSIDDVGNVGQLSTVIWIGPSQSIARVMSRSYKTDFSAGSVRASKFVYTGRPIVPIEGSTSVRPVQ